MEESNPLSVFEDISNGGLALVIFVLVFGGFLLGLTVLLLYLRKRSFKKHPRNDQLNLP